jgi:hypothetical protein
MYNANTNTSTTIDLFPTVEAPSIASSARIVCLTRSVPDLTKNDPEAAKTLAAIKNAANGSVNAKKYLIQSATHS